MKTNRLIISVIFFLTGSLFVNLSAQEALRAIVKKCETMDNIECNIVKARDEKTKKVTQYIVSFKFSKNEALKKEILAAFEKDKESANRENIRKKDGLIDITYFFSNGHYSFREDKNGDMTFTARDYFSGDIGYNNFWFKEGTYLDLAERAKGIEMRNKERAKAKNIQMKERAKVTDEHMRERAKVTKEHMRERAKVMKERNEERAKAFEERAKAKDKQMKEQKESAEYKSDRFFYGYYL